MPDPHAAAAAALRSAGALVVTAGAGMGVDSGLPDFRGDRGFWKAYPPYERLGISFVDAANPVHFEADPAFGWGFYGHRARLYRETAPHPGFALLLRWSERLGLPCFVVTSNVDGQFQKAGFPAEQVLEVHGSIHHLQCTEPCCGAIWPNEEDVAVDATTMRAQRIPRCLRCRGVARPNILMFGDGAWLSSRTDAQADRFEAWLDERGEARLVILELGAGTAVPTIRWHSERLGARPGATLVRVNPREPEVRPPHLSIASGAREALERIDAAL
ncbi:Sir2 family NAD-dependent protein deacetylase [Anaeromyxobacter sp. SG17]|uniref:SIR2 family NAD-dependent protein deacylase n=1 Tax=Anaeromyxobacter sp. SG17 TaxID=2925405 RepID=UPI001F57F0E8|nr:Sir2 family NAD-dependent protein deacetylase [Anaeromyxobacter sp. SG17]